MGGKIGLILILVINFQVVLGCSCNELKKFDIWNYLNYTSIIKGEIVSIDIYRDSVLLDSTRNEFFKMGGSQLIQVRVEEAYKGRASEIMVYRASLPNGGNCTKTFNIGENWYVFSNVIEEENYIGGCSWSQKVATNPNLMKGALRFIKELSSVNEKTIKRRYVDRDCDTKRFATGLIKNGQAEGYWEFLDKKGNPYMTGYYSEGVPDSLWVDYFRNEKEFALRKISAKTIYSTDGRMSVQYNVHGKLSYGYYEGTLDIPEYIFNKEEVNFLKIKAENPVNAEQ